MSPSFGLLKRLSFTHSAVYAVLLVVWLVPGLHGAEFVFGLTHGLGWIAMCLLSVAALRARVIPLRLAVAVAVIGAVDVGESPADTLVRELGEEWAVEPARVRAEALVRLPHQLVMFVGMAWLPDGAEVTPDHEHDAYAWWPADVGAWPAEADEPLRRMATLLSSG